MKGAIRMAKDTDIYLRGFTGNHEGIIGALAAYMHFNLRIPLNIPGHHGLEFMAIFVLVRLTSNIRYAATASVLGVGILLLIPGRSIFSYA